MSLTLTYSGSLSWDLDISTYGILFLTRVATHPLFGSIFFVIPVYFISSYVESEGTVKMRLLEAADVDIVFLKELLKFPFLLSHSLCIPVSYMKQVASSPTLLSPSHGKRVRATVSSIGWTSSRPVVGAVPSWPTTQRDDT